MTIPTQLVLRVLLENADAELYGVEIGSAAGLLSGTVHPILARLEGAGWLQSRWEEADRRDTGRPVRRYYCLTPDGIVSAPAALAHRPNRSYRLRPLGGES
jgi:PadR family transcriptional regulator, regulatory protein PadR